MDVVISLPNTKCGHNAVFTVVDQFSKLVTFVSYVTSSTATDIVLLFFDHVMCKFGMLMNIISDHNPGFVSKI